MMTREERLEFAKNRALQYVEIGDLKQAFASLGSDLNYETTRDCNSRMRLGFSVMFAGGMDTPEKMRRFIEGFK